MALDMGEALGQSLQGQSPQDWSPSGVVNSLVEAARDQGEDKNGIGDMLNRFLDVQFTRRQLDEGFVLIGSMVLLEPLKRLSQLFVEPDTAVESDSVVDDELPPEPLKRLSHLFVESDSAVESDSVVNDELPPEPNVGEGVFYDDETMLFSPPKWMTPLDTSVAAVLVGFLTTVETAPILELLEKIVPVVGPTLQEVEDVARAIEALTGKSFSYILRVLRLGVVPAVVMDWLLKLFSENPEVNGAIFDYISMVDEIPPVKIEAVRKSVENFMSRLYEHFLNHGMDSPQVLNLGVPIDEVRKFGGTVKAMGPTAAQHYVPLLITAYGVDNRAYDVDDRAYGIDDIDDHIYAPYTFARRVVIGENGLPTLSGLEPIGFEDTSSDIKGGSTVESSGTVWPLSVLQIVMKENKCKILCLASKLGESDNDVGVSNSADDNLPAQTVVEITVPKEQASRLFNATVPPTQEAIKQLSGLTLLLHTEMKLQGMETMASDLDDKGKPVQVDNPSSFIGLPEKLVSIVFRRGQLVVSYEGPNDTIVTGIPMEGVSTHALSEGSQNFDPRWWGVALALVAIFTLLRTRKSTS